MSIATPEHNHHHPENGFGARHAPKKYRLRAVEEQEPSYSKYLNKRFVKGISWTQLVLAILVCTMQICTMGLATGYYSYDRAAECGTGIWSSLVYSITAIATLYCIKKTKHWKIHVAFALHICALLVGTLFLGIELCGNIMDLRWRLARKLYPADSDYHSSYNDYDNKVSVPLLITSIVLNSTMTAMSLVQFLGSFLMTILTGRAVCCGQPKSGKLFELEVGGTEMEHDMPVEEVTPHTQHNLPGKHESVDHSSMSGITGVSLIAPPSYCETLSGLNAWNESANSGA